MKPLSFNKNKTQRTSHKELWYYTKKTYKDAPQTHHQKSETPIFELVPHHGFTFFGVKTTFFKNTFSNSLLQIRFFKTTNKMIVISSGGGEGGGTVVMCCKTQNTYKNTRTEKQKPQHFQSQNHHHYNKTHRHFTKHESEESDFQKKKNPKVNFKSGFRK